VTLSLSKGSRRIRAHKRRNYSGAGPLLNFWYNFTPYTQPFLQDLIISDASGANDSWSANWVVSKTGAYCARLTCAGLCACSATIATAGIITDGLKNYRLSSNFEYLLTPNVAMSIQFTSCNNDLKHDSVNINVLTEASCSVRSQICKHSCTIDPLDVLYSFLPFSGPFFQDILTSDETVHRDYWSAKSTVGAVTSDCFDCGTGQFWSFGLCVCPAYQYWGGNACLHCP